MGCLAFASCVKTDVDTPEFDVSFDNNKIYHEEDTVIFHFSGNAENIVFYPGIPGFNYDNINRLEKEGIPRLNFTTTLNNAGQTNTIHLLASTDFNGKYTTENVEAANWTDITAKALFATSATARASGNVDLTEFLDNKNKPLYLAFRYTGYKHSTLKQPKWAITAFTINNILADGTTMPITIATETGWSQVDFKNNTTQWLLPTSGLISIDGTTVVNGQEKSNEDNDDWAITKPLNLRKTNPDVGISIKNMASARINTHPYIFSKAGTYKIVFVAFNANNVSQKEVVKELNITINPK